MNFILKDKLTDLKSGVSLFLVALPLSLGIAMACNVPLFSGIIAGVIGGILGAVFSSSKYSVSGPADGLIAIIISSIAQLGSFEVFLSALVFVGIFQLIFSFIRVRRIGNFVPDSVIKGMLAALGIILIIKQLPYFIGYSEGAESTLSIGSSLDAIIENISTGAFVIGIISLAILIVCGKPFYKTNRYLSLIPATVIAVVAGIVLSILFSYVPALNLKQEHLINVSTISPISDFASNFVFPDFKLIGDQSFWFIVVTITLVATLETLLRVEAVDKLDPARKKSNVSMELIGQAISNIFCGLVGGLPVTSVVVRSSANITSGAKTKFSVIIHSVLLFVSVAFFPQVLALIPNACLAAILIYTGYRLAKPMVFIEQLLEGMDEFIPFLVTIVFMLFTNLIFGVCAGFAVAVITVFLKKDTVNYSFQVSSYMENGIRHESIVLPKNVTFFNKGRLIKFFDSVGSGTKVIIDGSKNEKVNQDIKEVIADFISNCKKNSIEVEVIKFYN